jgi:fructose-1-phosphate kinase PfkB-like protein
VSAGRAAGAHVVVDTGGTALLDAARAGADTLAPNAAEARSATGTPTVDTAVAALLDLGAGRVVVSDGAAGLLATRRSPAGTVRQPAVPHVTGNPTGAGDAATAGLAAAVLAGADDATALRWAAVLGAAAVLRPGAGEVDPADLPVLDARLDTRLDTRTGRTPRTEPPW